MNNYGSWKLEAGSWQKTWGWTLSLLCVLALAPALSANDDGEIVDASIVLTVSPDYKVKEEVSITKRLLSYQALDTDGDPRTPYCGALQTLTITRARVTTPAGKVVDCTPNALNLSTPDALVAHPELSSWQEMVVTFLGLEPGAQTELSYIREDKSAFRTTFEKKQILAWHFPIRKGTVTVRLPKGMALTYQIMNFQGEATTNPIADLTEYTFTFKDIPAFSDRDMHNGMAFLPTLYLTTTPSWEAAGKNLAALAEKFGAPNEAITKKAQELTKDAMTDLDKAIAIHKFVKDRFKEIEWPLQDSLLLFNDAAKTFAAGQGTNLELTLLLRAMHKAAGEEAKLALTGPLPAASKVPGLMMFERAGVSIDAMHFDPAKTVEAEPPGCFSLDEGGTTAFQTLSSRGASLIGEIEFKKDSINGTATIELTDYLSPYWRNLEEEGSLEDAVKAFLGVSGLKVEKTQVKILETSRAIFDVTFSGKVKENEKIVRLLPDASAFILGVDARQQMAFLPLNLPDAKISIKWTVKGHTGPVALPFRTLGEWGGMAVEWSQEGQETKVEAKFEVAGMHGPLPAAGYPGFQAALAAWQNPVVAGVLVP